MLKTILLSTVLLFSIPAFACDATSKMGEPIYSQELTKLCRTGYQVGYDQTIKDPRWSAEHLTGDAVTGKENRICPFKADTDLTIRAELSDYLHSGYARGHNSPAGDFRNNPKAMLESCYLSNMVPQIQKCFNAGVWSHLEDYVRQQAIKYGEVFVVTGPIFDGPIKTIGNGVRVPDKLFKVVYNPTLHQTLAFIAENKEQCGANPEDILTTQDKVEALSGLKLFPNFNGYTYSKALW